MTQFNINVWYVLAVTPGDHLLLNFVLSTVTGTFLMAFCGQRLQEHSVGVTWTLIVESSHSTSGIISSAYCLWLYSSLSLNLNPELSWSAVNCCTTHTCKQSKFVAGKFQIKTPVRKIVKIKHSNYICGCTNLCFSVCAQMAAWPCCSRLLGLFQKCVFKLKTLVLWHL